MKTNYKRLLLATATIAAMGMASEKAMAFDTVNWEWNLLLTENINKDVNVAIDVAPTGLLNLEKTQIHVGDLSATSTVTNIENNPPEEVAGGPIQIEDFFHIETTTDDSTDPNTIAPAPGVFGSDLELQAELLGGTLDEGTDVLNMDFRVFGEFTPEQLATELDAADLPQINSVATAVGNNQNIESTVAIELHDGQYQFGDFVADEDPEVAATDLDTLLSSIPDLGNSHDTAAVYLTLAGALGMIDPSTIDATSTVNNITNASINSEATAVGNNMSVDLAAFTPDDAFMVADVTQFSYSNITANSLVDEISVNNYSGFGDVGMGPGEDQIPLINSVATAIGNNMSVKISSPVVETP
jgi:hypothetical protein